MNEHVYTIQFIYGENSYSFSPLSHWDYSKGNFGDALTMALLIEDYIKEKNIYKEDTKVSNARLFGKGGELIIQVKDLSDYNKYSK